MFPTVQGQIVILKGKHFGLSSLILRDGHFETCSVTEMVVQRLSINLTSII